jgi:hypothetical protein
MTALVIAKGTVRRVTAGNSTEEEWQRLCEPVPWLPEAIVAFSYRGRIRGAWMDAVEDDSEGRTFPYHLFSNDLPTAAIAFRLDSDAIQFLLRLDLDG